MNCNPISAWKQKFGEIYAVKCDGHVAYLKKLRRIGFEI